MELIDYLRKEMDRESMNMIECKHGIQKHRSQAGKGQRKIL